MTVLLIEDEAEIRRFLRSTLPAHGYRLYEATTGHLPFDARSDYQVMRAHVEQEPGAPRA